MRTKPNPHQGLLPALSFLPKGRTTWGTSGWGEGRAWAWSVLSVALCRSCLYFLGTAATARCPRHGAMLRVSIGLFPWGESTNQSNAATIVTLGWHCWCEHQAPSLWVTGEQRELGSLVPYRLCVHVERSGRGLCGLQDTNWITMELWLSHVNLLGNLGTLFLMVFPFPMCLSNITLLTIPHHQELGYDQSGVPW